MKNQFKVNRINNIRKSRNVHFMSKGILCCVSVCFGCYETLNNCTLVLFNETTKNELRIVTKVYSFKHKPKKELNLHSRKYLPRYHRCHYKFYLHVLVSAELNISLCSGDTLNKIHHKISSDEVIKIKSIP